MELADGTEKVAEIKARQEITNITPYHEKNAVKWHIINDTNHRLVEVLTVLDRTKNAFKLNVQTRK